MAFTIERVSETLKKNWTFENVLAKSKFAGMFPNQYEPDENNFNGTIRVPIMTDVVESADFSYRAGYEEKYITDEVREVKLDQNFTVSNRIGKLDRLVDGWEEAKVLNANSREAKAIDKFMNKLITAENEKNVVVANPVKITDDNIVDVIFDLADKAEDIGENLEDCWILGSAQIAAIIVRNKLATNTYTIEGTSTKVRELFEYKFVQCDFRNTGLQIVVASPRVAVWGLAVEQPAQAGTYTDPPFKGQSYIVKNDFFGADYVLPEKVLKYPLPSAESKKINLQKEEADTGDLIQLKQDAYSEVMYHVGDDKIKQDIVKKYEGWFKGITKVRDLNSWKEKVIKALT